MVPFPPGLRLEALRRDHPRSGFESGQAAVDQWLRGQALQSQSKHLSTTRVLLDGGVRIVGFFTLAFGQVDFTELPTEVVKALPRRALPVAVLAWLGVARDRQGQGIGARLLAQALVDCHAAGRTFPFIAVVLDCVDERARDFYERWDFRPLPGRPLRLFLPNSGLDALVAAESGPSKP